MVTYPPVHLGSIYHMTWLDDFAEIYYQISRSIEMSNSQS